MKYLMIAPLLLCLCNLEITHKLLSEETELKVNYYNK